MKRNTSMAVIGLLAFALGAMAVYSFSPANEVQAATVGPAAIPDAYVLALDNETGLPVGAVVFSLDGLTCVALPNGAMECACPCDTELCENEKAEPVSIPDFLPDPFTIPTDGSIPDDTPTEGDIPDNAPDDTPTGGDIPDDTPDVPDDTPDVAPDDAPSGNSGCNQGRGNGSEGCDPGNSNHNQPSNDEGATNRGGRNVPNRSNGNGNSNGKGNGK